MESYREDCEELIAKGMEIYLSHHGRKVVRGEKRKMVENALFFVILEADGEFVESSIETNRVLRNRVRTQKLQEIFGGDSGKLYAYYLEVPIEFSFVAMRENFLEASSYRELWVYLREVCWEADTLLHRTILTGSEREVSEFLEVDGRKTLGVVPWIVAIGRYSEDPLVLRELKTRFEVPRDQIAACKTGRIKLQDMRQLWLELFA
jgi:hypothetical protein